MSDKPSLLDTPEYRRSPHLRINGVEHVFTYAICNTQTGEWRLYGGAFSREEIERIAQDIGTCLIREMWMAFDEKRAVNG